jgi:type VI secretion system protein ImpL
LLDFARNLGTDEATQVFGTTLPIRSAQASGVYGEEETRRLTAAFDSLFYSLCDRRIDYLPRETEADKLPGTYEFPREFRKLRTTLVQFLVDVCRPSQLRASPFLRGFYFSGVRPVTVSDVSAAPIAAPQQQQSKFGGGATMMFNPSSLQAAQAQAAFVPQAVGTKRVPQWMFLSHLFNDIILVDRAAMGASGASTKTSGLQRGLLIGASALALIFLGIFTWSYFGNRSLEKRAIEAAQAISGNEASGGALPSVESLRRLETLRQSLEELTRYRERTPLGLRWGLYAGDEMYTPVRRIYYDRFHQLLFGQTQNSMLNFLQRLPAAPGPADPYDPPYNTLKAYLITTSNHEKSTKPFLSPFLMSQWSGSRNDIGEERLKLAQAQFDFYSEDLVRENPYSSENDAAAVDRSRRYLAQFTGYDRVYASMLREASEKNKPINFNRDFPGSAAIITNNRDVAGAFTKSGWAFMQDAVKKADRFFGGESWVLGNYAPQGKFDMAKLEQQLRDRYTADYITKWRDYVRISRFNPYSDLKDAAAKLNKLSGNESPLLALFWVATQNTAVDSPKVTQAFDSVHKVVTPPATTPQYILPANQPYVGALTTLQASVDQVANAPAPDPNLANQALQQATAARQTTKQIGNTFLVDDARLYSDVQRLLEDPITSTEIALRGTGAADLNAGGRALCAPFGAMTQKFPFNPNATPEATLDEVNGLLRPGSGKLWVLYDEKLKKVLEEQGGQYVVNKTAGIDVNPAFLKFFNQAAQLSKALYPGGSTEPKLTYTLQPVANDQIDALLLNIDGKTLKFPGQNNQQFVWPGAAIRETKLTLTLAGGTPIQPQTHQGLWSVFRFFADANSLLPAGAGYNLSWIAISGRNNSPMIVKDKPLTYRFFLDMAGAPPVFYKDWLMGLRCVSQVAK